MRGNLARARHCGADRRLSVSAGGRNAGADSRNGAGEKRNFGRWERNGGADERLYSARRRILDTGERSDTGMQEKICAANCPMLNAAGFCESAWRRAEQVRVCPHSEMGRNARRRRGQKLDSKRHLSAKA